MLGLQTATVINNIDPLMEARVQIRIDSATEENAIWARIGSVFASDNSGFVFIPDIGDEVIVGFLGNQLDMPIVLGSLYSQTKRPPIQSAGSYGVKGIVSKSQLKISFDDTKKAIIINTPAQNSIVISDDTKSISISDQNGNRIQMTPEGIAINSEKDITLNAKGEIKMNAVTKISAESKSDLKLTGANVAVDAKMSVAIKGNASAELSSSGQTTVKGSIVMIN